jgi:hypothetical protein
LAQVSLLRRFSEYNVVIFGEQSECGGRDMFQESLLRRLFPLIVAVQIVSSLANAQSIISTVAGNGRPEFSGDGGPATNAALYFATDVGLDAAGNLYIADYDNYRIRKVSTSGVITTVVGNGTFGFSGDGGPATAASFRDPRYIAVDTAGNIYISDRTSYRVRKVSTSGIITTVAGNGTPGFSGDGGPATSATIDAFAVAVDSAGNLYIADANNQRIRKVNAAGTITTIAGNGTAGYTGDGGPATSARINYPWGIGVDAAGNVYFVDSSNSRVRKVSTTGIITTVAGGGVEFPGDGGPATSANLPFITELTADAAGNLYIAEAGSTNLVRKVSAAGIISTVAGNGTNGFSGDGGPATSAQLSFPEGLTVDSAGNIYIADPGNHRIRKVTAPPTPVTYTYYMPHLALGGGWQTTITYINYGPGAVSCSTAFFSDAGSPLSVAFGGAPTSARSDTLAAGGTLHQQSTADLNATVVTGWARAECSGPVKASLLFRLYQQGQPTAEAGVNAMSAPAIKFVTFAEPQTGVAYANPSAQTAEITFRAISSNGVILATRSMFLRAGEHGSANLGPLLGLSNFTGSIQIVSSIPIVSLSLNFEAFPAFSSMPPGELDGATPLR